MSHDEKKTEESTRETDHNTTTENKKSSCDLTVSEMEKAVRERIAAIAHAPGNTVKESTPLTAAEVAKTQKRQKNKLLFGIGGTAVIVAIMGMVGFDLWEKTRTKNQAPSPISSEKSKDVSNQRRDFGRKVDPFRTENQAQRETPLESEEQTRQAQPANNVTREPVFKRYLALETAEEALAAHSNSQTREQEKQGDKEPANVASQEREKPEIVNESGVLNKVTRIPYDPDLYIPENMPIPCALDYRFVSDLAGKIRCTITRDIYSASGHTRLIDKGTTAYGVYNAGTLRHGQGRVFIRITKLRTRQLPYLDIPMSGSQTAGELGESGSDGWIDEHWVDRFGGALMLGMIPDITAAAAHQAGKKDRNTDYTENSRQSMAEIARAAFENSVNIPPTLYKNQGEIITIITGQDIDFSAIYQLKLKRSQNR